MTTIAWTSETPSQKHRRLHRDHVNHLQRERYAENAEAERLRSRRRKGAMLKGPSNEARREMGVLGLLWCSECALWLPQCVVRGGLCRGHQNEAYRRHYAAGGNVAIRSRVHARKRRVEPLPPIARANLLERFDGRCAYCPAPATTFDHIVPVSRGGRTVPGNMVPACCSCNSRKRTRRVLDFLAELAPDQIHPALDEVLALAAFDGSIQ